MSQQPSQPYPVDCYYMLYTHSTISEVNAALPVILLEVSKSKGIKGLYMKLSGEVTTNMTLVLKSFTYP